MSLPKFLPCVLAALLLGCSDDQPASTEKFDPVTASDTAQPPAAAVAPLASDTPPPPDPIAASAKQASDYFEAAKLRADERLQAAEQDCRTLEMGVRDDCQASATADHESELAAARVEYSAQQVQAEGE